MTSVSKTVYVDKFYGTIKMKPVDVKSNEFIDATKEINEKDPKFIIGDNVRILKYKNVFAKGYVPNWSEEIFVIKKVKNTVPCRYVITDLKGEKNVGTFYENELQKTNRKDFWIEKVIKRKGAKLYVKWKGTIVLLTNGLTKENIV